MAEYKFIEYNQKSTKVLQSDLGEIHSFIDGSEDNMDQETVQSFGAEWTKFDQFSSEEIRHVGDSYFDIVPKEVFKADATKALDVGCGSGRWTSYLSSKVHSVECIDPSESVFIAQKVLRNEENVRVTHAAVENIPFEDDSFDFVFSLGVLHHVPNTKKAIINCVKKIKPGGHFLIYLYYSLDNRGIIFKVLLYFVTLLRRLISRLPRWLKLFVCDLIAFIVYLPLVGISRLVKSLFPSKDFHKKIPLSYYSDKTLNVIRNDALDRFGTPLEQRFSKKEIAQMMEDAGLDSIKFSTNEPFWHAIGRKS